jgi:hypothetical protein
MSSASTSIESESRRMRFHDWIDEKLNDLGSGQWITVYAQEKREDERFGFYSGLIPINNLGPAMEDASWDLHIGHGYPGCVVSGFGGKNQDVRYNRMEGPIEPLVIYREFHGAVPNYLEVSEEFRLLHGLYYDKKRDVHVAFDESGDAEDVITIKSDEVQFAPST